MTCRVALATQKRRGILAAMYAPAAFAEERLPVLVSFLKEHPFGLLITLGKSALDATPIPFLAEERAGQVVLRAHVARANPVWREARTDMESLVVFQGPHAYVTPSWYATKQQSGKVVPTWNYLIVQARGVLRVHEEHAWLREQIGALTRQQEAGEVEPWAVEDAPADFIDKLLGGIVGLELACSSLVGSWKLSQNRPELDRLGVQRGLEGRGSDAASELALLMRARED